jgi:hypothetical protein
MSRGAVNNVILRHKPMKAEEGRNDSIDSDGNET